jgi:hypothetical protein
MGAPVPSSERASPIRLQLAAFDHADELGRDVRILAAKQIEDIVQLSPPPVDLIDEIAYRERTHENG